jgi:beta-glucosidase
MAAEGSVSTKNILRPIRIVVAQFVLVVLVGVSQTIAQTSPPKAKSDEAIRQSVNVLLQKMTLEEKIGQLSQLFAFDPPETFEERISKGQIGSLLFVTDPALRNRYQRLAVERTRLKIPLIFGLDVVHGYRTGFPVPIGLAASWDPGLVTQVQSVAAKEAHAAGVDWTFAPMLDIARDPRWGRIVEGAGEDPYLGAVIAAAQVRGFQGDYIGAPDHVLACMKHFAGYGAAEGGRDYDAANIPDSQMHNVYLPPFHSAVRAGIGSAMSAYMDLNDVPATGNRWLLHDVLREQWKFRGFVVSDANAVKSLETHGYAKDLADAAKLALNAGVDMEMAIGETAYSENLLVAVKSGQVNERQIDEAARAILEMKMRLGLFEHPYVDEARSEQVLNAPEHRVLARVASEHTAVLLRNQGNLLPLGKTAYKKIAVIGPTGDSQLDTVGPWIFQEDLKETVTILAGLRQNLGTQVAVDSAPGVQLIRKFPSFLDPILHFPAPVPWTAEQADLEMTKAVNLASSSDMTILVLGELQNMIGEGASRESLDLPGREQELLEKVVATGKPVVLVLMNGRPLNIQWAAQHVPAILEVWYPGTRGGGAVANLLFGDANPGGKLPFTWPRNVGQVPMFYAHNRTHAPEDQGKRYWEEESTPLYPFGYGLSYSSFKYSNLRVARNVIKAGENLDLTVDLENSGDRAGDEVAQLYVHQQSGSASRPVRELKGFERVALGAHEKKTVHFSLGKEELRYWSSAKRDWVEDPAVFDVWVGGDSDAPLHGNFTVKP